MILPRFRTKIKIPLKDNAVLVATCCVIISLIFAITYTQLPIFPFAMRAQGLKLTIFIVMILLFSLVQFFFLRLDIAGFRRRSYEKLRRSQITVMEKIVRFSQYALIGILVITVIQIISILAYSILLSMATVWISHVITIVLLIKLAERLWSWSRVNKDVGILAFTASIVIIITNVGFSLAHFTNESTDDPLYITPYTGKVTSYSSPNSILKEGYFTTYILSFVSIWIATILLLYHYSKKIGRIKFWITMVIPLFYFLIQFQTTISDSLAIFRLSNPVFFGLVYTLIFSATKPIGGILAGVAFWTIARSIKQTEVRNCMLLSACGIMLLFSSNQASRLLIASFPPIEFAVISYMPLSAYFLLIGIYFSAISIAQDGKLRKHIMQSKKSFERQPGFLSSIGNSEMEQEIQNRVEHVAKSFAIKMEQDSGIPTSLDENEIKEYVEMAIREKEKKQA